MKSTLRTFVLLSFWAISLLLFVRFVAAQNFQLSGKVTQQDGALFVGATVEVINPANAMIVATTVTDMTGSYLLSVPGGTYNVKVTPPAGSGFQPAIDQNRILNSNTILDFILVPSVVFATLSGKVTDAAGNGVPNQGVTIIGLSNNNRGDATTDAAGNYSIQAALGNYLLKIYGPNPNADFLLPQYYEISTQTEALNLTQDTTLNLQIPATKRVQVHVQDTAGNPIPDVGISTNIYTYTQLILGSFPARGYSYYLGGVSTNSTGNATLRLFPTTDSGYTLTAKLLSAPFTTAQISDVLVTADTSVTITLNIAAVTLSGKVTDGAGNGVPNQNITVRSFSNSNFGSANTDASGNYSLQAVAGDYAVKISGGSPDNSLPLPQYYEVSTLTDTFSLTQNTTLNLQIPETKRVSVHVQDAAGNPVPNARVSTSSFTNTHLTLGSSPALGYSSYSGGVITSVTGDAALLLFPTTGSAGYTIRAEPPVSLPFVPFTINNLVVADDINLVIVLQFVHPPPVTTAVLSPPPNAGGFYPSPTTVTLSANAAADFTVATTHYKIDGGPTQTYTSPFLFSGSGTHTLTYWSVDNSGVIETPNVLSFSFVNIPPTLNALAQTVQQGSPAQHSQIAAASDAEDAKEILQVQISSDGTNFGNTAMLNGVTVTLTDSNTGATGINPNTTGQVFANVAASCGASNASFIMKVTDSSGATAMAGLNVTVNANTPPVLSYANQSVSSGEALIINPATSPSDNVGVSSIAVLNSGTFTGAVMVNSATGVVTVSGAAPVGTHTITIRAMDNCGGATGTTDTSFMLTVNSTGPMNTTTTVVSSVNPSVFGQSLTFTATVAPVSAGAGTPTGSVNFVIDGGVSQTQALAGGVATLTTSSLTVGVHGVQATYLGNAQFNTSSRLLAGGQTVICPAVTLTPASLPNGQVGTPYNQTLAAQPAGGNYTFSVTSGALPPGLSLNTSSGVISGAPSQMGNFSFRVTATGLSTCGGARDYQISVPTCTAISINPASLPGGMVGAAYNQMVSGSPVGSYNYSVTSGALPTGLTLNATTGAITGTSSQAGSFAFTITASVSGCSGARSFTVTIDCPAITLASLGNATAGVSFSGNVAASPGGAYTYSMQSGSLPSGLTLNPSTGAVTGLPSVSGTYSFTIKAQAANECSGSQQYSLTVGCPSITLSALVTPSLNSPYNQTVTASPLGNYSFAITAGALPAGLSLNAASGVISGTPTLAAAYNFTIRATVFGSCTEVREYSFVISGGGCPTITLPASVSAGSVGQLYNSSVVASPVGLYNYAVTAGSLPPGVTLESNLGALFGYPTAAGGYSFTIKATDSNNCQNFQSYMVGIGLGVLPLILPDAPVGQAYRQALTSLGAQGEARFAVVAGALPPEMTLSREGVLSGTPNEPGTHAFTVQVSDNAGFTGKRDYTLVLPPIFPPPSDPLAMTAAIDGCAVGGGTVGVTMTVRNFGVVSAPVNFEAPLPAGARALPDSCAANLGACAATPQQVVWNGNLSPNQTVTITFRIQFDDNLSTQTCLTASAKVVNVFGAPATASACAVNCTVVGPGARLAAVSPLSDAKAGSVLIYNIYTSATDPTRQNTRLSITNTDPARQAFVHLFFVEGASCSVADSFLCLTPNQTTSFLASDLDPGTTGYVVAVATDATGCPTNFNFLIGDEYVKFQSGHAANLGAQAITAIAGGLPVCDTNSSTATLNFNGVSYAPVPRVLALDSIPSRADGNDTMLILNRIGGNLGTGVATLGPIFGILYDDAEVSLSFTLTGGCQLRGSVTNNFPRTAPRFEQFIPAGRTGWMKLYSQSDDSAIGLTGAAINFNANATASAGAFNQGHNLHALTNTSAMSYVIPVFPPGC